VELVVPRATSLDVREQMIEQGWVSEGHGPNGVAMCALETLQRYRKLQNLSTSRFGICPHTTLALYLPGGFTCL
jgi:hypothetical protein